jgi:hypothetical protein
MAAASAYLHERSRLMSRGYAWSVLGSLGNLLQYFRGLFLLPPLGMILWGIGMRAEDSLLPAMLTGAIPPPK